MNVINTNIGALKAANASNAAGKALGTAMERLSTGKRINSAKDDAAGLAIATSMTSQVVGKLLEDPSLTLRQSIWLQEVR
ncbi:MAG: hypothetical protein VXX26_00895, partial [Pseudomonadota bacterium]|nr:hypothetical protein [Pseudomonadota bacterium]